MRFYLCHIYLITVTTIGKSMIFYFQDTTRQIHKLLKIDLKLLLQVFRGSRIKYVYI